MKKNVFQRGRKSFNGTSDIVFNKLRNEDGGTKSAEIRTPVVEFRYIYIK